MRIMRERIRRINSGVVATCKLQECTLQKLNCTLLDKNLWY